MINEQLSCDESALRNSTIGAIAMLAAAEVGQHFLLLVVAQDFWSLYTDYTLNPAEDGRKSRRTPCS